MDTAVFDPPIPYIGPIHGTKFGPGKMVKIQGLAPSIGYRFNINLQCGPEVTPRDDVAVQISVRFLDGYISLNSLQHGIWGEEQRGALSVKRNEKFEIIVLCDVNQYKVAINCEHYCEFPQRIHHNKITHLAIDGDVSIFRISWETVARNNSGNGPAPVGNNGDDFEMIDASTNRPSQAAARPGAPAVGFSQPPSYEATLTPPYPVNGPAGMPYPKPGSAMPYPSSAPTTSHAYPPGSAPTPLLPPPRYGPTSLDRRLKSNKVRKCFLICCAVVVGIVVIIAVVAAKISVNRSRYHNTDDTYYSNSLDNYKTTYGNNDYDNYGNSYGGYKSHNDNW